MVGSVGLPEPVSFPCCPRPGSFCGGGSHCSRPSLSLGSPRLTQLIETLGLSLPPPLFLPPPPPGYHLAYKNRQTELELEPQKILSLWLSLSEDDSARVARFVTAFLRCRLMEVKGLIGIKPTREQMCLLGLS